MLEDVRVPARRRGSVGKLKGKRYTSKGRNITDLKKMSRMVAWWLKRAAEGHGQEDAGRTRTVHHEVQQYKAMMQRFL